MATLTRRTATLDKRRVRALRLLVLGYLLAVPLFGFLQGGHIITWSGVGLYLMGVYLLSIVVMPVAFLMPALCKSGLAYEWPAVVVAVAVYWPSLVLLERRFVRGGSWWYYWIILAVLLLTAAGVLPTTLGAL
jgi:hypothetical protein